MKNKTRTEVIEATIKDYAYALAAIVEDRIKEAEIEQLEIQHEMDLLTQDADY